ncbi:MAG: acyltransferase [Archangiaceae bacterium]|nr:acyltransferase [Archangiaceae bacterium]
MGPLDVKVEGTAKIGHHAYFLPGVLTTEISVALGAELEVGPYSGFNCGVRLIATRRLVIGERVMVASMVTLTDVTLEDHVWVAHGAMLDPGVTIGEGSVVAAGSHVTRDVPPRSLAIGTPARNLKLDTLSRGR